MWVSPLESASPFFLGCASTVPAWNLHFHNVQSSMAEHSKKYRTNLRNKNVDECISSPHKRKERHGHATLPVTGRMFVSRPWKQSGIPTGKYRSFSRVKSIPAQLCCLHHYKHYWHTGRPEVRTIPGGPQAVPALVSFGGLKGAGDPTQAPEQMLYWWAIPKAQACFSAEYNLEGIWATGENANTFDTNRLTGGSPTPTFANGVCWEKAEPAPTCINLIH